MKCSLYALFLGFFLAFWGVASEAACDDSAKIYKVCSDQQERFQAKLTQAKLEGRLLVAVVGAEWCPWCVSLHHLLRDPAFAGEFAKKFLIADVALYDGKQKLSSGEAVLGKLQEFAKDKRKLQGIPVLALLNPGSQKAEIIDTEPLEKNTKTSKGHDPQKLKVALQEAADRLRD